MMVGGQIQDIGVCQGVTSFDGRPIDDTDAFATMAAGIAADLVGDDLAVGGEEGEGDHVVIVEHEVDIRPLFGVGGRDRCLRGR